MDDFNRINFDINEGAADQAAPSFTQKTDGSFAQTQTAPQTPPASTPQVVVVKKSRMWLGFLIGFVAATILTLAVSFLAGRAVIAQYAMSYNSYDEKLGTILSYIDRFFLWDVSDEDIENGMAKGLIDALGDKYAYYYTPEEYEDLKESVSGEYAGIGVSIIMNDDNKVEVYKVFRNSPAEEAGIFVGDLIIEAAGVTDFPELDDLVAVVRGEPGSTVDIVIERNGEKIPMTLARARVAMDTVSWKMLDDSIGYIKIEEFDTITVSQFEEAIDDLTSQGMRAVIFDLRDNPGGDYDTVVSMCDRVLPEGVIMTVKDKNGTIKTENSDQEHRIDLPIAVIINGNSASASEVFTGAIQDYNIATIVGEQSYGKGIVQSIFALPDGSGLKFTTQEYYTPSGDSINGVGITPDIEVTLPEDAYDDGVLTEEEDTQLQAAIESLK